MRGKITKYTVKGRLLTAIYLIEAAMKNGNKKLISGAYELLNPKRVRTLRASCLKMTDIMDLNLAVFRLAYINKNWDRLDKEMKLKYLKDVLETLNSVFSRL